jgi:hypothetical protein
MDELVKNALKKISNKTDEELKQMSFYELIDIMLTLEAYVTRETEDLYSGLLEE